MNAMDYIDRFIAKLLIGAQITCVAMAIINYFDWPFPPPYGGLDVVLVAVVIFGLPVVLRLVRGSRRPVRRATSTLGSMPALVHPKSVR